MTETPLFDAGAVTADSVAMDGSCAAVEFVAGDQRLWVTIPIAELAQLGKLCADLDSLAIDAKNGVTNRWHIALPQRCTRGR
jgi:hypothetical protein